MAHELAQPDHWSECGRATSLAATHALGRPHRSVLVLGCESTLQTMALLKYTIPANKPYYADLEFGLYPGTFLLHVPPLQPIFQEAIANHQKHHSRACKDSGRYQEHVAMLALVEWLDRQMASQNPVIEWDGSQRDLVWCYAAHLIYSRQFASFTCPACDKEYPPDKGTVLNWAIGEGLAAAGGRRFVCPGGHAVYALEEWNS